MVRGSVGNRAAVFALETLGFPVWALPTVVLPWHPGHGPSTRLTFSEDDFDKVIDDLIQARWAGEIKAVLTGYFGNAGQPRAVARLVRSLRERNADLLYVCDPVIGDLGGLYVPQDTAEAIRDELLPLANVATPNRYELAWLAGSALDSNTAIMEAALALGPSRMLVTSAVPIDNPPNGLGDLMSALFLARLLSGVDEERALQLATASVYEILARTAKRGSDELTLETDSESLMTPMAMVHMRRLVHPLQRVRR